MTTYYVDENGVPRPIEIQRPWNERLGTSLLGIATGLGNRGAGEMLSQYNARDTGLADAMNARTSALQGQKFTAGENLKGREFSAGQSELERKTRREELERKADLDAAAQDIEMGDKRRQFERTSALQREIQKQQAVDAMGLENQRQAGDFQRELLRGNFGLQEAQLRYDPTLPANAYNNAMAQRLMNDMAPASAEAVARAITALPPKIGAKLAEDAARGVMPTNDELRRLMSLKLEDDSGMQRLIEQLGGAQQAPKSSAIQRTNAPTGNFNFGQ